MNIIGWPSSNPEYGTVPHSATAHVVFGPISGQTFGSNGSDWAIIAVKLALLFSLWYRAEIVGPMLGRAKPVLQFGCKFVALTQGAHANAVNLRSVINRRGIDWCPAIWTKCLLPLGAAFSCLDVYFRFTRSKPEGTLSRGHDAPKRRARQSLTIRTMADPGHFRIGLRLVGDEATVA